MINTRVSGKKINDQPRAAFKISFKQLLLQFKQNRQKLDGNNTLNKIEAEFQKLICVFTRVQTGGESAWVKLNILKGKSIFMDSFGGGHVERISLCYDEKAMDQREEIQTVGSTLSMTEASGVSWLSEQENQWLQSIKLGDNQTTSCLFAHRKSGKGTERFSVIAGMINRLPIPKEFHRVTW